MGLLTDVYNSDMDDIYVPIKSRPYTKKEWAEARKNTLAFMEEWENDNKKLSEQDDIKIVKG